MNYFLRASHVPIIVFVFFGLAKGAYLVDFSNMLHRNMQNVKRDGKFHGRSFLRCCALFPFHFAFSV